MYVKINVESDSERTAYYAELRASRDGGQVQTVRVYPPSWDVTPVSAGTDAHVFVDPPSGKPMVIEIGSKRLWAMS